MGHYKEWIIQYHGNLQQALQGTDTMFDIINKKYAIIKASDKEIDYLKNIIEIEYLEETREIYQMENKRDARPMTAIKKQKMGASGKTVTVGWISHKENINYSNYKKSDGESRLLCIHDGIKEYSKKQIISSGNRHRNYHKSVGPNVMDMCVGNNGIAAENNLTQEIINDMTLNRQIIVEESLGQLQKLLLAPALGKSRTLDMAAAFAPDDAIIDVFVIYNSFSPEPIIITPQETNLYPLIFPYLGARGTVREMLTLINEGLENMAIGSLAPILGNEPFNITPTDFRPVSISKSPKPLKGRGILIGIIDTGIDYTNPVFIDSNGESRIISIWDQTIGSSSPYGYGTIYDQEAINKALALLAGTTNESEGGTATQAEEATPEALPQ